MLSTRFIGSIYIRHSVVLFILLAFGGGIVGCSRSTDEIRAGDIIFQVSQSTQSQAIKLATHSDYTHCGVVLPGPGGRLMVLEAIQPVVLTPLDEWEYRGVGHHYVVKRLKDAASHVNDDAVARMDSIGTAWLNRDYDSQFDWSDQKLYCSELVWKIYNRALGVELAPLRKLSDFDLANPVVKAKLQSRYGSSIPYDESVVAPSDLFDSDRLTEVTRGGVAP